MASLAAVALLGALALVACTGDDDKATQRVFAAPPWTGQESYNYALSQPGSDSPGTCTLKTDPGAEPGRTRLSRLCTDGSRYEDNGSVLVDSASLEPYQSTREFIDREKNKKTTYTNVYEGGKVRFSAVDQTGKKYDTTRDLPQAKPGQPEPGWYDDEELLWLARGIPLQAGFSGTYTHVINAGQPRVVPVDVRVDPVEKVKVAAGEFQAWKVRFEKDDNSYLVWVEEAAPHRVVKARIEDVTYELAGS